MRAQYIVIVEHRTSLDVRISASLSASPKGRELFASSRLIGAQTKRSVDSLTCLRTTNSKVLSVRELLLSIQCKQECRTPSRSFIADRTLNRASRFAQTLLKRTHFASF